MMGDKPPSKKNFWFVSAFLATFFIYSFHYPRKNNKTAHFPAFWQVLLIKPLFGGSRNTFTPPPLHIYTFKTIVDQLLCTFYKHVHLWGTCDE
jgi:hypothetical protein